MAVDKEKSREAFANNVRDMLKTYKEKGVIGGASPADMIKARKQAIAAAFVGGKKK